MRRTVRVRVDWPVADWASVATGPPGPVMPKSETVVGAHAVGEGGEGHGDAGP